MGVGGGGEISLQYQSEKTIKVPKARDMRHLILLFKKKFFLIFLAVQHGMWDLSSLTRDQTCTPCTGSQSLNHWTVGES